MSEFDSDEDISWLTQEPNLQSQQYNFDIVHSFIEEDLVKDDTDDNFVSLEDVGSPIRSKILYGNVEVEDISSDDGIDNM